MVVNYPGPEFPFIRIHETKHASRQQCEGTVLGFEFTGAPTRYYPIELPENRALNDRYQDHLREQVGDRVHFAGRLANYVYIDMDDCMRQALDTAEGEVLPRPMTRPAVDVVVPFRGDRAELDDLTARLAAPRAAGGRHARRGGQHAGRAAGGHAPRRRGRDARVRAQPGGGAGQPPTGSSSSTPT